MTTGLAFTVPGKPFAKGRPRSSARVVYKNGKPLAIVTVYTPAKTREGEAIIRKAAKAAMGGRPPLAVPLRLRVKCVFEPPASWPKWVRALAVQGRVLHTAKPDFDNLAKVIDALNEAAFTDDAIITDALISKRYGAPARTEIMVEVIDMGDRIVWPKVAAPEPNPFDNQPAADLLARITGAAE